MNHLGAKETVFADDFTVADKLTSIRDLGKTNSSCPEVWLLPKCFKLILKKIN